MADIIDLIKSRRTIKYFLPKFVSWENIAKIIDAGRHAPSSGNIQNWKFIAIIQPEVKQAIAEACYEQYEIVHAGAFIVVCNELEKAERYYGLRGERLYSIQNCAAAIENMLLEAHSLGLGTRWIGAFDEEDVKAKLDIPEEVRPQAIIAVGYAKDVPPKPPKYPLETVVYFHKWRRKLRDPAKYMHDIATIITRKREAATEFFQKSGSAAVEKAKEKILPKKTLDEEEN